MVSAPFEHREGCGTQMLGVARKNQNEIELERKDAPPVHDYDPRDLLKLYLYGYLQQIRSPRRLEAERNRTDTFKHSVPGSQM